MQTQAQRTRDDLLKRLQAVNEELYRMPSSKLGTQWHADRCCEVQALARRLEMLTYQEQHEKVCAATGVKPVAWSRPGMTHADWMALAD